jgi:hypothetical protein
VIKGGKPMKVEANDKQLKLLNTCELSAILALHEVNELTLTISNGEIVAAEFEGGNYNE